MQDRRRRESTPEKPQFTKVDNYFIDLVMPKVTGAQWKAICAVLRRTVGEYCEDASITVDEFIEMTGNERQAVIAAVRYVCLQGAVERRTQQVGRQRTFRFRTVPHANLKEVPKRDSCRSQEVLPFDILRSTKFENQTPMTDNDTVENVAQIGTEFENQTTSRSMKIKLPTGSSEYENQTPNGSSPYSVIRSRSEDKNAVEKTDRDDELVENPETKPQNQVVSLCRFCRSQHDDPVISPAVALYYDQFKLMPNEGFRHDIWITVQDLVLWSRILDGWWYENASGRRVEKNPLGIKQMLNAYDEAIARRSEARA